jgi:hypothetical protein
MDLTNDRIYTIIGRGNWRAINAAEHEPQKNDAEGSRECALKLPMCDQTARIFPKIDGPKGHNEIRCRAVCSEFVKPCGEVAWDQSLVDHNRTPVSRQIRHWQAMGYFTAEAEITAKRECESDRYFQGFAIQFFHLRYQRSALAWSRGIGWQRFSFCD